MKLLECIFFSFTCIYALSQVNGKYVVKSGTDFRSFGKLTLTFGACGKFSVDVEKIDIISSVEENSYIKDIVSSYMGNIRTFTTVVICLYTAKALLYFCIATLSCGFSN